MHTVSTPPQICQCWRCSRVAFNKRGYQARKGKKWIGRCLGETQTILSAKIYDEGISISRDIAEFLALQLSRSIGDELGRERLADMGRSLRASFSGDREINIIEMIENYPDSTVRVNLNRLARLQSDLTLFVERIEPVLAVVEELLPELVCDCLLEGKHLQDWMKIHFSLRNRLRIRKEIKSL